MRTSSVAFRHIGTAVGSAALLTALATPAAAQTWQGTRKGPSLSEIVAIDRTGETTWPFGREDVAGDGNTFGAAEQAIDVRTLYATTDNQQLWLRVYLSATTAVTNKVSAYVFIDGDGLATTGGTLKAPEIDTHLSSDTMGARYENVVGIQGNGTIAGVWRWNQGAAHYEPIAPAPAANEAPIETGTDLDPIRVGQDQHAYLQARVNLDLIGVTPACNATFFVRSTTTTAGLGDGDFGAALEEPCRHVDANQDKVPDIVVPPQGCTADNQCPGGGICVDGDCILPHPCIINGDCGSSETCFDDRCIPAPSGSCTSRSDCGDRVCVGGQCTGCSLDGNECGAGFRCAPTGVCVEGGASSGAGGGSAPVDLQPGELVQGGACACGTGSRSGGVGGAAALFVAALGLGARRARRRAPVDPRGAVSPRRSNP